MRDQDAAQCRGYRNNQGTVLAMPPETRALHVCSLTYHEILADPRVFKQACALQKRGYRVTVLCPTAPDRPDTEVVEGIEILRFDAYGHAGATPEALAKVDHMEASRPDVMARMGPYMDRAAALREIEREIAESAIDAAMLDRVEADRETYRGKRGVARIIGKFAHLRRTHRMIRGANPDARVFSPVRAIERARRGRGLVGRARRDLYQANGYLFALNLLPVVDSLRPDLVHAHDIYCLPGGVAFAKQSGAKLLYDAHEYEPARATKMPEDGSNIADPLELDCLRHVDRMTTVSLSIRDLYAKRFDGPVPDLIYNAPPAPRDDGDVPDIRALTGLRRDVSIIMFTGGVQREARGLDKVLVAMTHLPEDVVLVAMGPRVPRNDAWLLDEAERLGMTDRLHLVPGVPATDVVPTISGADIAIVATQDTSLNQRFSMPNKLFEGAFAGVPLVVPDLPDMGRFVAETGLGAVMNAHDPESIAATIRNVLADPARYTPSEEVRARLQAAYSWGAQEDTLGRVVAEMIGAPGASPSDPRS